MNLFKSKLSVLLIVMLSACSIESGDGSSDMPVDGGNCNHTNQYTETTATCISGGEERTFCSECNLCLSVQSVGPTGEHDFGWSWVDYVDPTCTEDGAEIYNCLNCDETKTVVLPAHGHNYSLYSEYCMCCI